MRAYFDDSLERLVSVVCDQLGETALAEGVVLRDTTGRLAFFSADSLTPEAVAQLTTALEEALGAYARTDRLVADKTEYGVASLLTDTTLITFKVSGHLIRMIDRRLVGADWLRRPSEQASPPPRFVFSSIKGGVGRSTALSVVAADLAARGLKVLVVDLDIEAPGLGAILLDDSTLPEFGLLDALVENGLAPLDETFLADMIGPSPLAGNHGRIDVMPVLGRRSLSNPADVLAKIARAYAEDINEQGEAISVLDQICALIDRFSDPRRYDVILVDARAGLHETTAGALLGLGAEVFLFGLDEPQTYQGFKILLSHIARLNGGIQQSGWFNRLTIVQGKAPADSELRQQFVEGCQNLMLGLGLAADRMASVDQPDALSSFDDLEWNDDLPDQAVLPAEEPTYLEPIAVLDDSRYKSFNPQARRDLIEKSLYSSSYQPLLDKVIASLPVYLD
ncbi:KGGVGR-motif variant AAA ATPase [Pseudomonas sp. R5(2019)]|uniref:KGGVGR-motif variant AAA ATPase n=1 Tax=Pseudomonas sp. R5(2019) TaxID=2697566 RepID=UPI001412851B|nr:AAA family ATPase [Pseudomonas sp. R5(2019)]NBA98627.1 AAA family ATPase [Pseudomonas sp. R5(2019)]